MSTSPELVFNAVNLSPVPPSQTPSPSQQLPLDGVTRVVEINGSTFAVRGGSPEGPHQVRGRHFQALTVADAQGEVSIPFRAGSGIKVRVGRTVILGRHSPSPGTSPRLFEDGDIDRPVRHLHRGEPDRTRSNDDRTGPQHDDRTGPQHNT